MAASFGVDATAVREPRVPPEAKMRAVDVAKESGLRSGRMRTWSASAVDYDVDGDEDVLVGFHFYRRARLYSNDGDATYTRVAKYAWPNNVPDRHFCDWADVDLNGRPDVYCSAGRGTPNHVKGDRRDNELWLQNRRGEFRDAAKKWGVGDPCGRGRAVAFLYANGDRYPDLFVGNEVPRAVPDRCDHAPALPNEEGKLYINKRGRDFKYLPRYWDFGAGPGARCAEVLDVDRDGWDDLFTCGYPSGARLYLNRNGRGFTDVTARQNLPTGIRDAAVTYLRKDRRPDLALATYAGFSLMLNQRGRYRSVRTIDQLGSGQGVSVAAGDADGDGDTDVYGMIDGVRRNLDDRIYLNRDRLRFIEVRVPSAPGAADDVIAIHPRSKDRVDFLVLNGYELDGFGPVQLIHVERRR